MKEPPGERQPLPPSAGAKTQEYMHQIDFQIKYRHRFSQSNTYKRWIGRRRHDQRRLERADSLLAHLHAHGSGNLATKTPAQISMRMQVPTRILLRTCKNATNR